MTDDEFEALIMGVDFGGATMVTSGTALQDNQFFR
jgi:hypothetical protein